MSNFRITYKAYNTKLQVIKEGNVIARNKMSEFDALAGYENHLKKTLPNLHRLECITLEIETMIGFVPTGSKIGNTGNWLMNEFYNAFKKP